MSEIKSPSPYGYIRAKDCEYAAKIGYEWYQLPAPKTDYKGRPFTHVMMLSMGPNYKPSFKNILEPDTQVGNFSTNIRDALFMCSKLHIDTETERLSIMAKIDSHLLNPPSQQPDS